MMQVLIRAHGALGETLHRKTWHAPPPRNFGPALESLRVGFERDARQPSSYHDRNYATSAPFRPSPPFSAAHHQVEEVAQHGFGVRERPPRRRESI
jgi:hypothetical protein